MANRYSNYSGLDDVRRGDREAGFIGFNDRLRPDQIQSGLLQKSENGRLDLNGQWQARKGIQNRLAPFAVSGTALRLPTEGEISAGEKVLLPHSILSASCTSDSTDGTVTLTTGSVHQEGIASRVGSTTTVQIQFKNVNFTEMTEIQVGTNIIVSGASYSGTGGSSAVNTTQAVTGVTTTGNTSNDTLQFTVSGLDAAVSGDAVFVKVNQNHNLAVGDTIEVNDITVSGGAGSVANVNGSQTTITDTTGNTIKYTVEGITSAPTLTVTEGSNMTATGGTDVTADSYSRSSETLTINETAHGLSNGTAITISGLSVASGTNPNGDRFISNVSTNSFDVVVTGLAVTPTGTLVYNHGKSRFSFTPQELTTGTPPKFLPCAGAVILSDESVSEVTCGCKFSDPNEASQEEYILLASNAKVVAFNTSTLESFDIPLKSGETIPEDSTILQVFNKVIIFRDGQISLENNKFF